MNPMAAVPLPSTCEFWTSHLQLRRTEVPGFDVPLIEFRLGLTLRTLGVVTPFGVHALDEWYG